MGPLHVWSFVAWWCPLSFQSRYERKILFFGQKIIQALLRSNHPPSPEVIWLNPPSRSCDHPACDSRPLADQRNPEQVSSDRTHWSATGSSTGSSTGNNLPVGWPSWQHPAMTSDPNLLCPTGLCLCVCLCECVSVCVHIQCQLGWI